MEWTLSKVVAEFFYCVIGFFFILNGVKALKDSGLKTRVGTAAFWFLAAFTFMAGPYVPSGSPVCAWCLWPV